MAPPDEGSTSVTEKNGDLEADPPANQSVDSKETQGSQTLPSTEPQSGFKQEAPDHRSPDGQAPEQAQNWDPAFEVSWDGPNDPDNPRSKKLWLKWAQVLITATTATCVTCVSSLYTTTYKQLETDLGASEELLIAGLSLFVFALGISPMVFGPMSEFFGRRPIYIISTLFFIIWLVPCAVAQNMATLLVGRFFSGFAGSAFLSVAGGTVGDLFDKMHLQLPMLVFTSSPFLGPVIGPIMGGFINYFANWRWSFYVLIIWAVVQWSLILLFVPETYHPVLLRNKARRLRKETGDERWHAPIEKMQRSVTQTVLHSCYRPFLLLTKEPMCLNLCLLSTLLLSILYLFFGAFSLVFTNIYGFNLWQVGLSFVGIGIGMGIAIVTDPLWHYLYIRQVRRKEKDTGEKDASEPEFRLPSAVVGAPLVAVGLFWFGFTIYPQIHWIVPLIGSVVFGLGTLLTFSGVFTFLVDAYPVYAASALAANSFLRSSGAAAFPLFGQQMYEKIGYQWATGLLAFLCLAMCPFPYIFFRYGKRIRKRSSYAAA